LFTIGAVGIGEVRRVIFFWKLDLHVIEINDCLMIFVKGEFSKGLMHGSGRYLWADGVVYEVNLYILHMLYMFF